MEVASDLGHYTRVIRAFHDDEESEEEEQSSPLDFLEHLVDVDFADREADRRAGHGDNGRLDAEDAVDQEADDCQEHDDSRLFQRHRVGDGEAFIHFHDAGALFNRDGHFASVVDIEDRAVDEQYSENKRSEVDEERHEVEPDH